MNTYQIKVNRKATFEFSKSDLVDLLASAICCIDYWAMIDTTTIEYKKVRDDLWVDKERPEERPSLEEVMIEMWIRDFPVVFCEDVDEDQSYSERHLVYFESFLSAITKSIEEGYWTGNDLGDVDGMIGDVIAQYAVFGEIVYG